MSSFPFGASCLHQRLILCLQLTNSTSATGICACSVKGSSEEVKAVKLPRLDDLLENIQTALTEIDNNNALRELIISHSQPLLRTHILEMEHASITIRKGVEVPALFMP